MAEEREITIKLSAKNLTAAGFTQARQQLAGIADETDKANKHGSTMRSVFGTAVGTFAGFVSAQAVLAGVRSAMSFVGEAAFGMNATLEKSTLQFTTLMGDSQRAEEHVRSLFQFAKETPFETGPIIEASRLMQTFGGDALNTMDNLRLLGDASAATGAPIEDLGFWVGRMYASLKGGQPIGEATMRLMELGVLAPETRTQLENLAKTAGGGEKAFEMFQGSLGKFSGAMVAQAGTWEGLMSSISDSINITLADALHPFFEVVKEGAQIVLQALGSEGVASAFEAVKASITGAMGGDARGTVLGFVDVLITTGEVFLRVAGFAESVFGAALNAVRTVVYSLAGGLLQMAESGVGALLAIASAASHLPGVGDKMAGVAGDLRGLKDSLNSARLGMNDLAGASARAVVEQSTMGRAIEGGVDILGALRTSLHESRAATDENNAAAIASAPAMGQQAAGFSAVTEAVGKATKAKKEYGIVWGETSNIVKMQIEGVLSPALFEFTTDTDNAAEAMQDLIDNLHRAAGASTTVAPVLASSMKLPFAQLPASVAASGTATDGFFGKFKAALGETGMNAQSLSGLFAQAFTGGGGALGALQAFATQGLSALFSMVPGVGPFLQQFAGPIIAGFSKIASKVKSMFKGLFGGPDKDELAGREVVHAFEGNLATMLTAQQKAEAGGESWKMTVIAIRDAYIAQGRSAEEAMVDAERLWKSSKQGGAESERVVAEIERKMKELADATRGATAATDEQAEATSDAADEMAAQAEAAVEAQAQVKAGAEDLEAAALSGAGAFKEIARAIMGIPRDVDVNINRRYTEEGEGGPTGSYSIGTKGRHGTWFPDFSTGQVVRVDQQEAIVPRDRVGEFIRDMVGGMPASGGGQSANVYIVTDWNGARQVTEAEFRQVQARLNTGGLTVPARVITGRA